METLSENPLTICDCGHNIDGVTEMLKLIVQTEHDHLHIVWGMVADKQLEGFGAITGGMLRTTSALPKFPEPLTVELHPESWRIRLDRSSIRFGF